METDKGGWTVIQRGKFPIQQDFYKDWESYKNGFGNLKEEFWLGNENIRVLCQKGWEIRFDLQDEKGEKGFALYQNFNLSGENYRIAISGYTGTVGDDMQNENNFDFSTKDKGNIGEAQRLKSGWWIGNNGYYSNLNGIYQPGQSNVETVGW
ncbi:unnamed protein product [Larinioides sclopetarius]|uniref:Fibrinogen C-terminal domain-containing protein n=1 Tax=Larinioides sclopetarius TaxID=280406 RepID=A0AAV1ZHW0_9ARAC